MIRKMDFDNKPRWFSEEKDWIDKNADNICCWRGCIIEEENYEDFRRFVWKEAQADVEPIGSFTTENRIPVFVFIVKSNIAYFSIWRFRLDGIMWWYDYFWEMNGGRRVSDKEIMPIIEKLGLTVKKESCLTDYVLQ
jgi:hypothetical protein